MVKRTSDSIGGVLRGVLQVVRAWGGGVALAVVLAFATTASAQTYSYLSQWGSAGSTNGLFNTPYGIAVDSSGNVFVADSANSSVQKFNATGTFTMRFGNTGANPNRLGTASGVALDNTNSVIYVTDTGNNRIQRYSMTTGNATGASPRWGAAGTGNGQFASPIGVALDSSINVYVTDTGNNRIQRFDSVGTYSAQWGASGTGNGQFSGPTGIAVDSANNIYVADTGNNRIQKFSSAGTYITQWGTSGTGNGQFSSPRHIAVDSSNNIYVADRGNTRIQKFTSTGTYTTQFGTSGAGNGQFATPQGVAISSTDIAYVADTGNNRIQRFGFLPAAPSVPGVTGVTSNAITFTWQDNSSDETGFKVYADAGSAAPTTLRTTTAANATSWNWTTLSINTQYAFQVAATNANGDSAKTTTFTTWTLAATPGAPTLSGTTATTVNVAIAADTNPATTTYAIRNTTVGQYVQANGSLGATAVYQTAATWGTKTVTGMTPDTVQNFVAIAQNGASVATAASSTSLVRTLAATPLAPTVSGATTSTLAVAITAGDGNPTSVVYSIQVTTTGQYVQANGSLGATAVYQTAATWGTKTITGLSVNTAYSIVAFARNTAGTVSASSPAGTGTTLANTPVAPLVGTVTATTANVAIASGDGNPAATTYAIRDSSGGLYVQASGALGATAVYQTAATWATKTVTGLSVDTVYDFVAYARNLASVTTVASSATSINTLAAVALAPTVSGATTTTLSVAITAGDGNPFPTTYSIQVSPGGLYVQPSGALGASAVFRNSNSWGTKIVTGLSVDTAYSFTVVAKNTAGTLSAASPAGTGRTLAATPVAPVVSGPTTTTLNVAIGTGDGNPSTTTYAIQNTPGGLYVQAGGALGATAVYQTAATWGTKTVTGLSSNTVYSFVVIAQNGASVSTAAGPSASGTTLAATPVAPVINNASSSTLDVAIGSGDGNSAATTYAIQNTPGGLYVQAGGTLGATAVFQTAATWGARTVSGLSLDTVYSFVVIAKNGAGTLSAAGPSASGRTLAATPVAPVVSGPTTTTLNVAIGTGDGNPATTTYAIQNTPGGLYVQVSGALGATPIFQTSATWGTKTVTGLSVNRVYTFVVIARNGAAVSTAAGPSGSGTTLAATPVAPVVNNATSTTLDVAVGSGDGNPVSTTYAIQNTPGGQYVQASGALGATAVYQTATVWGTTTVTGLSVDTVYSFVVIGRNGAGTSTAAGPSASGRTLAATPLAPVISAPALTTISVTIASGDGNSGTVTYAIQSNPGGLYVQAGGTLGVSAVFQTAATWGTKVVTGLSVDSVYTFAAIAKNGAGANSPTGPSSSGNTLAAVPLAPAVGNPTSTRLDVSIASGDGNPVTTQYAIGETPGGLFVQADGTLSAAPVFQTATVWATVTVSGLTPLTTYSFAVTARNGAGTLTAAGPTNSGTTLDGTQPNALAPVPTSTGPTNATSMAFAVDFDEAVQNFNDVSDLVITHVGTASTGVTITGGPVNYTVTVSGISGDGSLKLAVNLSSDVLDLAGNSLATAPDSASVIFDHTPPALAIGAPTPNTTASGPVDFTVTYTGASATSLDASDITLNATASALGVVSVTGSGNTYTVRIASISGDGAITISIAAGTAVDAAGNQAPAAGPSGVLTVDSAPQLSLNMGIPLAVLLAVAGAFSLRRRDAR